MATRKLCDLCGAEMARPTGSARMSDERWAARRFCSIDCAEDGLSIERKKPRKGPVSGVSENTYHIGDNARKAATEASSKELLRRSIAYGLANDSDLGMGYSAFMDRAHSLGLVKNHGRPVSTPGIVA